MRLILVLLCSVLLTACVSPAYRNGPQPVAQFDLGPVAAPLPGDARPWRLSVATVNGLEDTAMRYRLLYADPTRVMEYAQSRWVGVPGELLRRRLEPQLFWPPGSPVSSCGMHLELQRFEQVFVSPAASAGALAVRAVLRQRGGKVVDERLFALEVPAATTDAAGGVAALAKAGDQLAQALNQWQAAGLARESWRTCRE